MSLQLIYRGPDVAARALLSPKSINLDPVRRAVDGMDADKAIVHSQRKRSDDTVEAPDLDSALGNYQGSNGKRSTNEDDVPEDLDVLAGNYQG